MPYAARASDSYASGAQTVLIAAPRWRTRHTRPERTSPLAGARASATRKQRALRSRIHSSGGTMRYLTFVVPLLVLAVAVSGPLGAVAHDATPTTPAQPAAQPSQPAT